MIQQNQPTAATLINPNLQCSNTNGTMTIIYCPENKVFGGRLLGCPHHPNDDIEDDEETIVCGTCDTDLFSVSHFRYLAIDFDVVLGKMVEEDFIGNFDPPEFRRWIKAVRAGLAQVAALSRNPSGDRHGLEG